MDLKKSVIQLALVLGLCLWSEAFSLRKVRQASTNQIANPATFMDPSFSTGGQAKSQTQGQSVMQAMSAGIAQTQGQGRQIANSPPQGSLTETEGFQTQGTDGTFQTQSQKQPGIPSQSTTLINGGPAKDNLSSNTITLASGGSSSNQINDPVLSQSVGQKTQQVGNQTPVRNGNNPGVINVIHGSGSKYDNNNNNNNNNNAVSTSNGIQQSVNGNNMFNPGNMNSMLLAPPGTGNSQFNNLGNSNSMFGGSGLSLDASMFANPRTNPDGTISGAAGNANGPPINGPGMMQSNSNVQNNNMFGPPNFFMNPGASFGTK